VGRVVSRDELRSETARARAEGRRVVFTNGCFDLIHAGHVRYLRAARALGDLLVVGLNSDRSVSALKAGRPVVPEAQRAEVLASLEMVDMVTIFDEDTPYELIRHVLPDVLVKGGDWKVEDIVGSDLVPETRSLPFEEGLSTTFIIEKIKSLET
jgi:D-beta-D-heptose 7-phosphate kinase/D-beta-D-heptose 1-phosphate adenosyltransferase